MVLLAGLRVVSGMCEGVVQPAFYALSAAWFPEQERGMLCNVVLSGTGSMHANVS